jgi:hypothetical protein
MASQGTERFALTLNRAKVIFRGRGSIESYNLARDKKEARDLSKEDAVLTSTALDPLILYLARPRSWDKATWGAPNALSASFPSELPKAWLKPAKRRRGSKR